MRGTEVTEKQLKAAEQFVMLHYRGSSDVKRDQVIMVKFEEMLRLIALYGAIRCESAKNGGSADEPGECYKKG